MGQTTVTVDVDHVHELDHDVAHEEGDGEEGEEAGVAGLAPHNHLVVIVSFLVFDFVFVFKC